MLDISVGASKQLCVFYSCLYGFLTIAVILSQLHWVGMIIVLLIVWGYGWRSLQQQAWRTLDTSIVNLQYCSGSWFIRQNNGHTSMVSISPATFVTPALTVLCLKKKTEHKWFRPHVFCVLLGDAIHPQVYRRLRVALKAQAFLPQ